MVQPSRPRITLRLQLAERHRLEELDKLSSDDLIKLLLPHAFWGHIDFWIFEHLGCLHRWFWWVICQIKPYDIETHSRHWWFEKIEDWKEYQ